jgi:hypothetical protein
MVKEGRKRLSNCFNIRGWKDRKGNKMRGARR